MSRSTFDSIIDDYIEDDWEKKSALGVSVTVVVILTSFLALLFTALSISLGVQHGNQSRKIAFTICTKEWELSNSVNILKHFEILCVFVFLLRFSLPCGNISVLTAVRRIPGAMTGYSVYHSFSLVNTILCLFSTQ